MTPEQCPFFEQAYEYIADQGMRLGDDGVVYNQYGIPVYRFEGHAFNATGDLCFQFARLPLETDWNRAKVLEKESLCKTKK